MRWMNYLRGLKQQVCLYFATILDLNKSCNIEAYELNSKINIEYISIVAIDAYEIKVNNLNVELVIQ